MKKIGLFSVFVTMTVAMMSFVNEGGSDLCKAYIPLEKGTILKFEDYDSKDKLKGSQTLTIMDVIETATVLTVKVHMIAEGDKKDDKYENDFEYSCEGGTFTMSMESFISPEMKKSFEGMEMKIEQENLSYPSELEVGQTLPDGHLNMEVFMNGMSVMKSETQITNRKVEAMETMETTAGSFPCIKLSYTTKSVMAFATSETNSIEWISPNIGAVRSEHYDKNNKLEGYRILASITRN